MTDGMTGRGIHGMTHGMAPAELHDALVGLVYPGSLSLDPTGRRLAMVGLPGEPAVHAVAPGAPGTPRATVRWSLPAEPVLVRWTPGGDGLWAVVLGDHGEATRLLLLDADGAVRAETTVAGAIEDLVTGAGTDVLLRVADVGSERDGMSLGRPVLGPEPEPEPRLVRGDAPPLRRLERVALVGDRLERTPVELGFWTVWDVHAVGDVAAVVASREASPAGYYDARLLLVEGLSSPQPHVRELHRPDGELARPRLSPDARTVAVLEGRSIVAGVVHLIDLATGARRTVAGLDDVTDLGWLDADRLWFAGWDDLGFQVGRVALDAGPRVTDRWTELATLHGDAGQPSLAVAPDGTLAYAVREAPGEPPEVVALSLQEPGSTPVTDHHAALRSDAPAVTTEPLSWSSPDGTEVHGLLLRPATAPDGPLPLVLLLHGGPTWLWSAAFAPAESNHLALVLAAAGAAVLLPNPRGSSGRGQAYALGVAGDVGGGDLDDVLAGLDRLVADGVADPDRVAVMGLSYGGYLSAHAALSQDRFRAAVVMSGVSDWLGFVSTSAIGAGYASLYHPAGGLHTAAGREALVARSPLYREAPVATPTLLVHGAEDRITPLAQAEQLVGRLARAGIPTELAVYPREGHELLEPEHRRDAARRVMEWLRRHGVLEGGPEGKDD